MPWNWGRAAPAGGRGGGPARPGRSPPRGWWRSTACAVPGGDPARLIDVESRRAQHRRGQPLVRELRAPSRRVDRSDRSPRPTIRSRTAPARALTCRAERSGCARSTSRPPPEGWARTPRGDPVGHSAVVLALAAPGSASRAGAMLNQDHRDRRQLRHLMATNRRRGPAAHRR